MPSLPFRSKVVQQTKEYKGWASSPQKASRDYHKDRVKMEAAGWQVVGEQTVGVVNKSIVVTYQRPR